VKIGKITIMGTIKEQGIGAQPVDPPAAQFLITFCQLASRKHNQLGTILSPFQTIMKEMNRPWRENRLPHPTNRREQRLRVLGQDASGRRYHVAKKVEGKP
jgi:hypothetical protein